MLYLKRKRGPFGVALSNEHTIGATVRLMTDEQPFKFDRLHHVLLSIPTGGEEDCRSFWGNALGMTELVKPPILAARGGCWFRGGGLEVHLGVEKVFTPARKAHPAILVTDLAAFADHLQAFGITVTWDDNFPGFSRFYSYDPFGNRLEFLEEK
jgi:catechol 2,3-dioxygenase-like lactoylglutathione lyase family enzyme